MESAARPGSGMLESSRTFRLILLRRIRPRREGSLAAALAQSMALAVMGTAGAYPAWVLVKEPEEGDSVLGAAWAITQTDPAPGDPLLGSAGAPLMLGMAFCCLFSVLSGSVALTLDFLARRRCRLLAPLLHGLAAVLMACAAALGSCLLALVRGRIHTEPELRPHRFSTSPGQSLFLAFLACALASTATGLSCTSPARVEPARSSWDFRVSRGGERPFFRYSLPGSLRPNAAAAAAASSAPSSSSSTTESSPSLRRGGSSAGSGHVHWKTPSTEDLPPEDRSRAKEEGQQPPAQPGGRGWLRRYYDSAWWLLGTLGELARRLYGRGTEAAPPPAEESQEAGSSRWTDV